MLLFWSMPGTAFRSKSALEPRTPRSGPPEPPSSSNGCGNCRRDSQDDGTLGNLDLGLIGNCSVSALIDRHAQIVWCCLPRFDGDPVFHALLGAPQSAPDGGVFSIEIENQTGASPAYLANTAFAQSLLRDEKAPTAITDFC